VAYSPDGRRLASGRLDGTVKIWDSATGQELVSFQSPSVVTSVAFSPDGQCLASTNQDGSSKLWETVIPPDVQQRRAALVAALPSKPTAPAGR
jgi:WD40 repeat protein